MRAWLPSGRRIATCIAKLRHICETRSREPLSGRTTIGIGGSADGFALPQDRHALLEALTCCRETGCPYLVIGNGSNVVFDDAGFRGVIISTVRMRALSFEAGGIVHADAGVLNQALIRACHREGLGGIEYLYSVPGTAGGAVVMNAGRGREHALSVGDHVECVSIWDGDTERTLTHGECAFAYRDSVFRRHPGWTILSVTLRLPAVSPEEGKRRVTERMAFVERTQDRTYPNAGTVFSSSFEQSAVERGARRGGIALSQKTSNWFLNDGAATSRDVRVMIDWIRGEHARKGHPPPQLEIDVFDRHGRRR